MNTYCVSYVTSNGKRGTKLLQAYSKFEATNKGLKEAVNAGEGDILFFDCYLKSVVKFH